MIGKEKNWMLTPSPLPHSKHAHFCPKVPSSRKYDPPHPIFCLICCSSEIQYKHSWIQDPPSRKWFITHFFNSPTENVLYENCWICNNAYHNGIMKIWKLNKNKQEIEQLYISIDNLLQNNGKTSQNILSVFTY